MQYGEVRGIGKPISRLVQGTALGFDVEDKEKAFGILDTAYERGVNTFDTAHVYGAARSRVFGEWVRERGLEDKVVVLAKGAHHGEADGKKLERVHPEAIVADLEEVLGWMKRDHVDLYVLHRDDPGYPVGPIVESLNGLKTAGKISAFGGSNWTHLRIKEANDYAAAHGLEPFAVSSPNYSLAEQVEEPWDQCVSISGPRGEEARRYYAETGTSLFTWSSLAAGFFSGRYRRDNLDTLEGYEAELCKRCYCYEQNFERLDRAESLAKEKGVTVAQIALSFVVNGPLNVFALTFSANSAQVADNAAALELQLTQEERDWLDLKSEIR